MVVAGSRRVLVAFHEEVLGGASLAVLRVLPLLEASGWEIECWAPTGGALERALGEAGWPVAGAGRDLRLSRASLREPPGTLARLRSGGTYLRGFRDFVSTGAFDLVHANTLIALPEAAAARTTSAAALVHVHEMLEGGLKGGAAAALLKRADGVVTVSHAAAAALAARGVDARVAPNGVALPPALERAGRSGPLVVGTVGTVSARKGSDVFVDAAARLADLEVEFRLVGPLAPGPEAAWAGAVADRARAAGMLVGASADVSAALVGWDVFAMPSREDPFPLAVLEAMAAGLPVVASAVDGIPEQLGGEAGMLVAPGDPEALAGAIRRLAEDGALRARLGAAGRSRVESWFTIERQAEALDRAYADALRARSA